VLNFVYAFDENYNDQAFVSICSLIEKINVDCHISIIHKDSSTFKSKKSLLEDYFDNLTINLYTFTKEDISLPNLNKVHVSEATYYRLFFDKYLPRNIDHFLYLDADVVCLNNPEKRIIEIFKTMKEKKFSIAARTESTLFEDDIKRRINIGVKEKYFNAGIMFVDYKSLLENNLYEKLRIKLRDINDFIKFWDQDVLNSFFNGNYYELDNSMNYDPNIYQENNLNEKPEKIIFLHYQGSNKPWTVNGVFGEYSKFYHQYFNKYGLGDYHITSTWKKVAFFQFLKNIISLNFLRLSNPFKYLTSVISYLIDKK
tara:strand:- start:8960 stop:9898 length:939 start_codon:yes stop_codon:yes gene_type:complete